MMDGVLEAQSDRAIEGNRLQALVGWTHAALPNGIDLRVQCAPSSRALQNEEIEVQHLLMTRNQALLLARYLLEITGQTLPPRRRRPLFGRFWGMGR